MLSKPIDQSLTIPGAIKALSSTSKILQEAAATTLERHIETADLEITNADLLDRIAEFRRSADKNKQAIAGRLIAALQRGGQTAAIRKIEGVITGKPVGAVKPKSLTR